MSASDISRRQFLKLTGGTMAAAGMLGFRNPLNGSKIPIATQMWVVRREAKDDLAGVLKSLADLGFQGVEFADDYFGHSVKDIRKMLDDNGLKVAGNHINLEHMLGDRLGPTVELHETLGARHLIIRSLRKEQYSSRDAIMRLAWQMNEIAERLEPYGMRVGFHNHAEIFEKYNGEMAWNILADNTRADVILQLDTGNAMHSPVPVEVETLILRNPGRTDTAHIKPFSKSNEKAYLGEDDLNWKNIIHLMETVGGTEWYIIEYEIEGIPPLQALKDNIEIFKNMLAEA